MESGCADAGDDAAGRCTTGPRVCRNCCPPRERRTGGTTSGQRSRPAPGWPSSNARWSSTVRSSSDPTTSRWSSPRTWSPTSTTRHWSSPTTTSAPTAVGPIARRLRRRGAPGWLRRTRTVVLLTVAVVVPLTLVTARSVPPAASRPSPAPAVGPATPKPAAGSRHLAPHVLTVTGQGTARADASARKALARVGASIGTTASAVSAAPSGSASSGVAGPTAPVLAARQQAVQVAAQQRAVARAAAAQARADARTLAARRRETRAQVVATHAARLAGGPGSGGVRGSGAARTTVIGGPTGTAPIGA